MGLTTFALLGVIVALGAFVQRIVGFGLAVVAAPFVILSAPQVMPAALLVTVLPMPVIEMWRGHHEIQWRPLGWALLGRLLTMPIGVWIVTVASPDAIAVGVAVMALIAAAGSVWKAHVEPRPIPAFGSGLLTGISATTASIGGPFFSLVLQSLRPAQVRATLAPFFFFGALSSLGGLAYAGHAPRVALLTGAAWLPFMFAGMGAAQPLRNRIDPVRFRKVLLTLVALSAVGVLVRVAFNA